MATMLSSLPAPQDFSAEYEARQAALNATRAAVKVKFICETAKMLYPEQLQKNHRYREAAQSAVALAEALVDELANAGYL